MNDPHVVALLYRIEHSESIDWSKAGPLFQEEPQFKLSVEDKAVRFDLHDHYATEEEAQETIGEYIRVWEFDAQLRRGRDCFRLVFEKSQIIDRSPTPGAVRLSGRFSAIVTASAKPTVLPTEYPAPPSNVTLSHDAELMHGQYIEYRRGRAKLAAVANFCLTVLQKNGKGQKGAAARYRIEKSVLRKIGYLTAKKGGSESSKADGMATAFTPQDRHFLKRATQAMIRRVAEEAHAPKTGRSTISLSDLPSLEDESDIQAAAEDESNKQ